MTEEVQEIFLLEVGLIVTIKIMESFLYSFPLLTHFLDQSIKNIICHQSLRGHLLVSTLALLLFFHVLFILGIALRVMSEYETCEVVDPISDPLAEVCIGKLA